METRSASEAPVKPITKPKVAPKTVTRSRAQAKKPVSLGIPEELLLLTIDDNSGVIPTELKPRLHHGMAAAFLAELVMANKIQMAGDRLTMASTTPTGDALCDDILAMITSDNKPRKLGRWIQVIGSKLTIKQVALRLVERKVVVIEKKQYAWVIPYPAFALVQASAKYPLKQHLRGIILAGEPADPTDILLLSLVKACRLMRLMFTRDERIFADNKVNALVQGEVFGEAVAKLLAEK
jgi:golgi phosphoprotein 3